MTKNSKKNNVFQTKVKEAKAEAENLIGVWVDITKVRKNYNKIFRARTTNKGVHYSLGYYDNAIDAARAYNKKTKSIFGSEKKAKKVGRWNELA